MRTIARILLCLVPLALASCDDDDVTGPSDIQGEWRLQSLQRPDFSIAPISDPARFTARFDEDGRIGLRADCNSCGGTFRIDGESLSVTPVACTRVFCPSAPLDTLFVSILEGASSVDIEAEHLRVSSPRGSLTFVRGEALR